MESPIYSNPSDILKSAQSSFSELVDYLMRYYCAGAYEEDVHPHQNISELSLHTLIATYNHSLLRYRKKLEAIEVGIDALSVIPENTILVLHQHQYVLLIKMEGDTAHIRNINNDETICVDSPVLRNALTGVAVTLHNLDAQDADTHLNQPEMVIGRSLLSAIKPAAIEIACCSIFMNLFVFAVPLFTMNVYDRVVPNFATDTLWVLLIGVMIALLFDLLFKIIRHHISCSVSKTVQLNLENQVMQRFLSNYYPANLKAIGHNAILFKEIESTSNFIISKALPALIDLPFIIVFWAVIAYVSGAIVWIPIAGGACILIVNILCDIKTLEKSTNSNGTDRLKAVRIIENLSGIFTIRAFNAGRYFGQLFQKNAFSQAKLHENLEYWSALASALSVFFMQGVSIFVVAAGVYQVHNGNMSVGAIIAVTILSNRSMVPLIAVGSSLSRMRQIRQSINLIKSILCQPAYEMNALAEAQNNSFKEISVNSLQFSYSEKHAPALQNVNLHIKKGEKIAVLGKSGSGKSTLLKLLSGQEKNYTGNITIDGHALHSLPPSLICRHVGLLQQNNFFFAGTLRENVTLGDESLTQSKLQYAYDMSECSEFINKSGEKDAFQILEHGDNLSGGQKQMLALARIFVRNHDILLLDEPTHSLDLAAEARIKDRLKDSMQDKTVIYVTHRLALLPLVNRIIIVDNGRIIADGDRDTILQKLNIAAPKE